MTEPKIGDPADRLEAAASDQFQPVNRRAGYGSALLERIVRQARRGGSLYAGEGKKLVEYFESRSLTIDGVAWVLIRGDAVALERCPKKAEKMGAGEWFVPGGKVEDVDGGDPVKTLARELSEEWPGVKLIEAIPLPIVQASRVGALVPFLMQPYRILIEGDPPEVSGDGNAIRWTSIAEAMCSPVPQVRMMIASL